jgi:agmatine deiminase
MITDAQTNFVYFSGLIADKYPKSWHAMATILDDHDIQHGFLEATKDIWCRDYMPIQTDKNRFVQFRYEAPYLFKEPALRSIPEEVSQANGLSPIFSDIILDGGNVIRSADKVIMTNRIFKDNPTTGKATLLKKLENLLQAEVLIIPAHNTDETGHADGHIRFINDKTVLVNELAREFVYWKKGFMQMIKDSGLHYAEMPWFEKKFKGEPLSAIGIYVNYLEIGNLIIFPVFEVPGNKDQQALDTITKAFPNKIIEPVNINEIGLKGGLMNCISWNILQ